jgi:hypothetical protein
MKLIYAILLAILPTPLLCQPGTIGPAVFMGTGLNDATSGGDPTGPSANYLFSVVIDGTGTPNTFKWQVNGGAFTTGVHITGTSQLLAFGVTIKFSATTGHTLNDAWLVVDTAHSASNTINYISPGVGAVFRSNEQKLRDSYSIFDFGAKCDGTTDDTAALSKAFTAADGAGLYFPGGTCKLNNSASALILANYSGRVWGEKNATISCTTLSKGCIQFNSPSNLVIDNISFTYSSPTTTRNGAQLLAIISGEHVWLSRITAYNGNSAGVLVQQSDDVHVSDLTSHDMLANGLFVTNTTRMSTVNTHCNNVQDYCEEFSGYDPFAGVPSGVCQYITSTGMVAYNSFAGGLINGCPDSSFSNFIIANTYQAAIVVTQDSSTTTTKWPYRVSVSNGVISNTGVLASGNPNAHGIYASLSNAPAIPVELAITGIVLYNTAEDGIRIGQDASGDPSLFSVILDNVVSDTNVTGVGVRLAAGGLVTFSNLQLRNSFAYGLAITGGGGSGIETTVNGTGLTIYDSEQASRSDPRVLIADTPGAVTISQVSVIDDRNPAIGYQLQDSAAGPVSVTGISYVLPFGSFSLSPGSTVSKYLLSGQAFLLGSQVNSSAPSFSTFSVGDSNPNSAIAGKPGDLYVESIGVSSASAWLKTTGVNTTTGWSQVLAGSPIIINGDQTGPATPSTCQLQVEGTTNTSKVLDVCYDTTNNDAWIQSQIIGSGPTPLYLNPLGGGVIVSGDMSGTNAQFTVEGTATPAEKLEIGYDVSGDFGWIQAIHSGVANKQLQLNANGGGVYVYDWLGINQSTRTDGLTNFDVSGDSALKGNVGIGGVADHSGSYPLKVYGAIRSQSLTALRPVLSDANQSLVSGQIDLANGVDIKATGITANQVLLWGGAAATGITGVPSANVTELPGGDPGTGTITYVTGCNFTTMMCATSSATFSLGFSIATHTVTNGIVIN